LRPAGFFINLLTKIFGHTFKANNYELYLLLDFKMRKPHRKIVRPLTCNLLSYVFMKRPFHTELTATTKLKSALLPVSKCALMETDAVLTSTS